MNETFYGFEVVASEYAIEQKTKIIRQVRSKKRRIRKKWFKTPGNAVVIESPACFFMAGSRKIVMHPDIFKIFKQNLPEFENIRFAGCYPPKSIMDEYGGLIPENEMCFQDEPKINSISSDNPPCLTKEKLKEARRLLTEGEPPPPKPSPMWIDEYKEIAGVFKVPTITGGGA